jgi:hypothetical protein
MPAKMTRSVPSAAVRAARRAGSHPHLAWVLREGQKSATIHAPSGVIWGIPVYKRGQVGEQVRRSALGDNADLTPTSQNRRDRL